MDLRDKYEKKFVGYLNCVSNERIHANSYLQLKKKAEKIKNLRFHPVDWLFLEVVNGKRQPTAVPICFRENRINEIGEVVYGEFSI